MAAAVTDIGVVAGAVTEVLKTSELLQVERNTPEMLAAAVAADQAAVDNAIKAAIESGDQTKISEIAAH